MSQQRHEFQSVLLQAVQHQRIQPYLSSPARATPQIRLRLPTRQAFLADPPQSLPGSLPESPAPWLAHATHLVHHATLVQLDSYSSSFALVDQHLEAIVPTRCLEIRLMSNRKYRCPTFRSCQSMPTFRKQPNTHYLHCGYVPCPSQLAAWQV